MLFIIFIILFIYGVGNLVNMYYDFVNGFDIEDFDDKILVKKEFFLSEMVVCIVELYFLGMVFFMMVYFCVDVNSVFLVVLFFSGVLSLFIYIGGIGLKYIVFGDVLIILMFGVLIIVFVFFI